MSRTIDITATEFPGAQKVRYVNVDVDNYDDQDNGNGEPVAPSDVGMNRFQQVNAEVMFGEGTASTVVNCVAQYDYQNNSLRLLYQDNDGGGSAGTELSEVAANADEGALVRLEVKGR